MCAPRGGQLTRRHLAPNERPRVEEPGVVAVRQTCVGAERGEKCSVLAGDNEPTHIMGNDRIVWLGDTPTPGIKTRPP